MFMGSGAVTFAMVDRAKYIIANDNDEEVFNLFMVVKEHKTELVEALQVMPVHEKLFQHWREHEEHDSTWQAARFLMLSNFGYIGKTETLHFDIPSNCKSRLLFDIEKHISRPSIRFMCCDFREVLNKIAWILKDFGKPVNRKAEAFIYADPPYIGTGNNYQESFTKKDTEDLFELLTNSGIRFGISEFDNPFVLELAKQYSLHVTELGERRNLKNRRVEIYISNYEHVKRQPSLFESESAADNKTLKETETSDAAEK